jgi:hypothetical protein
MRGWLFALVTFASTHAIAQDTERLAATDINVRTFVAFKSPAAAVQKLLPAGWEVDSPTDGPSAGYNLAFYLVDFQMGQDAGGKPFMARPTLAFVVPVKKVGSNLTTNMVPGGFTAQPGTPGPYGNFVAGNVTVDRQSHTEGDGKAIIGETWTVNGGDGSALELQIEFARGMPIKEKVESKYYSNVNPEFYRIYRVEQGSDIARSTVAGIDHLTKFKFKASGGMLASLFDGSEQLVSIISLPFFSRAIYLPMR